MNVYYTESEPPFQAKGPSSVPAPHRHRSDVQPQARILYVDDEPFLRQLAELTLNGSKYLLETVEDGMAAWEALHAHEYNLLITDNDMPRLTGLELIRKVFLARIPIPIILASSIVNTRQMTDLPQFVCAAMLPKPFTSKQLASVVDEVLGTTDSERFPSSALLPSEFRLQQSHSFWDANE